MTDQPIEPAPLDDNQADLLASLLYEYISAETFYSKQRLVEGNPALLLSNEANSALAALTLQYDENQQVQQSLELHRALLQRCRVIGIPDAFLELRHSIEELAAGQPDDTHLDALIDAIGEFITTDNWGAARAWLDAHPDLLTDEADLVFGRLIETYERRAQSNVVRQLTVHRDLLRACREMGVDAAFERMANPPDTLDLIADNTIAVLTDRPDAREEWGRTVVQSRLRAAELDDQPMLDLLRVISRLLGGEPPDQIEHSLDDKYLACWERILAGIGENISSTDFTDGTD